MGMKSDLVAAFTANLNATQRTRFADAYISVWDIRKPDGTPFATNAEKADAIAEHLIAEWKRITVNHEHHQATIAVVAPSPLTMTE